MAPKEKRAKKGEKASRTNYFLRLVSSCMSRSRAASDTTFAFKHLFSEGQMLTTKSNLMLVNFQSFQETILIYIHR